MSDPFPRYNPKESEPRWQRRWEEEGAFKASLKADAPKYYVLEMFPYPSGHIHMGHVRNYSLGDVMARFKRAQGYSVLHPMGWDAFGLPAENAAIQRGAHPAAWTYANIEQMRRQLKSIGLSYDWSKELATCDPDYYRHEQRFFLEFLKKGLAYRKESYVNWDPVDNTVLANEQVIEGRGWRSGAPVERRKLSQWFLRISGFAEELLQGLEELKEWPEKVRLMQERWIGKSTGATIRFDMVGGSGGETLEVYTTRPDTLFGMSFCAISPNHPLAAHLAERNPALGGFITDCNRLGTSEEAIEKAEKKGFDTGLKVRHPFDAARLYPVYVANFVLMEYGTGAIFGCPAHDQRDFEFAKKYGLPIIPVVADSLSCGTPEGMSAGSPGDSAPSLRESQNEVYTGNGILINSDFLNGLDSQAAKQKAVEELEKLGKGTAKINYRLRDWGISRQRYWGCPIPVIYCEACGAVPVPEAQLPVVLPEDVSFDTPGNPLDHHPTWKHVDCPACGKPAQRETDTFDTFFESSWYFARFASLPSPDPLSADALKAWMPVDCYIGGIEHAVLHLLYSRFFMRALEHCGLQPFKEPFKRLETQGMICHESYQSAEGQWLSPEEIIQRDGAWVEEATGKPVTVGRVEKMSKSKKNTVDPTHIMESYGADAARLFMLSDSPPERDLEWTDAGIEGAWRYINRLWKLIAPHKDLFTESLPEPAEQYPELISIRKPVHHAIMAVEADIEAFHFNKAIARIRQLTNLLEEKSADRPSARFCLREAFEIVMHLIQPFLPHLAEALWAETGHKDLISLRPWPVADKALAAQNIVTIAIQINGKLKATHPCPKDTPEEDVINEAKTLVLDALKDKDVRIVHVPNRIVNFVVKG